MTTTTSKGSAQQQEQPEPMDLKLDPDDCPRRLLVFPGGNQILAYGGDDGATSVIEQHGAGSRKVRVARHFDDGAVRAVAVSDDGKRVAVGFDNGSTRIYNYNDYKVSTDNNEPHPFIPKKRGKAVDGNASDCEDDDEEGLGGIFSQPADGDDDDDENRCWAGPQFGGPIRDLKFMPSASDGSVYILAMASESGLCLVNVTSPQTMDKRYLQHQAEKEHDEGGIRGVCFCRSGNTAMIWMASLAMDGRLCLWNVTKVTDGEDVPVYRDFHKCVTIQDIGETNGATPSDRSCWPLLWNSPNSGRTLLALPGMPTLQLKRVTQEGGTIQVEASTKTANDVPNGPVQGHVEPVVAMALEPKNQQQMVTSGQDGRVVLWQLQEDEDGLPTATFAKQLGTYESIVTSMYWDVDRHHLSLACANGTLITIDKMNQHVLVPKVSSSKSQPQKAKKIPKEMAIKATAKKAASELEDSDDDFGGPISKGSKFDNDKAKDTAKKDNNINDDDKPTRSTQKLSQSNEGEDDDDNLFGTETDDEDDNHHDMDSKDDGDDTRSKTKKRVPPLRETLAALESDDDEIPSSTTPPAASNAEKQTTKRRLVKKNGTASSDDEEENVFADVQDKPKTDTQSQKAVIDGIDDDDDDDDNEEIPSSTSPPVQAVTTVDNKEPAGATTEVAQSSADAINAQCPPPLAQKSNRVSIGSPGDLVKEAQKVNENSPKKSYFIDDEADDAADDDEDVVMEKEQSSRGGPAAGNNEQTEDEGFDGSGGVDDHQDDDGFGDHGDDDDLDDVDAITDRFNARNAGGYRKIEPLPEAQAAFAPSSTPLDLPRRFLCWNHVGSVTLLQGDDGPNRSTVDIHFTDSAFRRPVSFTDNMGFILGSLGDDGGIFATALADDDDDDNDLGEIVEGLHVSERTKKALKKSQQKRMNKGGSARSTGSSIYFHRYETFVGNLRDKDWTLTLPDGELVLGCAAGGGWAAVMTNRKFLRLFSSGGAQGQVLWLPGAPLTLVGRNRFLAAFFHEGEPLRDGTQKLGYMLYDAIANKVLSKGSASCISSGSHLSWAGFSNDCSLMAMDTDGMLSMLITTNSMADVDVEENVDIPSSWEWAPLLDTVGLRKSSDDNFWPITVYNGKLVCIPLKGGTEHPDASRRPVTTTLSLKMPLARNAMTKSHALEELSVRSNLALAQKRAINMLGGGELLGDEFEDHYRKLCAQVDKVTLKLFAATVEAGKLERALDLVDRLQLEQSYNIAMKIAESHHKLYDMIEEARDRRFAVDDLSDEDGEDDGHDYPDDNHDHEPGHPGTSPPQRESRPFKRISPDANQGLSKSNPKRSFADHFSKTGLQQERNVKSKR